MTRSRKPLSQPLYQEPEAAPPAWGKAVACLVILLAGMVAYSNSLEGPFVFDGEPSILWNKAIRRLYPLVHLITDAPPSSTVDGRPILHLSYAINYQFSGTEVRGYHLTNLAIHLLAGLFLFGLVRRTLTRFRSPTRSLILALVITLLWVLHPLQTASVTYINQRAESLLGLWYLLTVYAALRGAQVRLAWQRPLWSTLSILACWLGAGTKEVIVSAPLIVMLYDRVFLFPSWQASVRCRWRLYLGLWGSWLPLGALVWMTHNRGGVAGFGSGMGVVEYALSQAYYIMVYLKLCVWPHPLVFFYGRDPVQDWHAISIGMLVVGGALLATLLALRRWPWAGFLGLWFFATLAASSSVVPIATQIAAEHRMYLALAAVVTLAVVSLDRCSEAVVPDRWHRATWSLSLAVAVILILGLTTYNRNKVYHTALRLWADVAEKVPMNYTAWDNLGYSYRLMGDLERALEALHRGIAIRDDYANLYDERARTYEAMHKLPEAVQDYNRAIELAPDLLTARSRRAMLFLRLKRYTEAEDAFNTLLETQDDMDGNLHFLRAQARILLGRFDAARSDLETVLARNPGARRQVEQMLNILHKRRRQHKTEGGTDKG